MTTTLYDATGDVLDRLGDSEQSIWSRDEIVLYYQDGYDQFCQRTKCLFDIYVIPNVPRIGNWQTDLEYYLVSQRPGSNLSDEPIHFTGEHERHLASRGGVTPGLSGPANLTAPAITAGTSGDDVPTTVFGGPLPQSTIEVLRVTFNGRTLKGVTSAQMRQLDPNYHTRTGDPQMFVYDKDGLFYLRLVPGMGGDADYDDVNGAWGAYTYTDDTSVSVVTTEVSGYDTGGYGVIRHRTDWFPSGAPWGMPTQIHPHTMNAEVELIRLGRDMAHYPNELPLAYQKYVTYWAMAQALRRAGPGQDLDLADHYEQRFEMGVNRMEHKRDMLQVERMGKLGGAAKDTTNFGIGDVQAPYPYSKPF